MLTLNESLSQSRQHLADLETARPGLQAAYDHAVADESSNADHGWATLRALERNAADQQAARAEIERLEAAIAAEAARAEAERVAGFHRAAITAVRAYADEAIQFSDHVEAAAAAWPRVFEAAKAALAAERSAQNAGAPIGALSGRSIGMQELWRRTWAQFLRAVNPSNSATGPWLLSAYPAPNGTPSIREYLKARLSSLPTIPGDQTPAPEKPAKRRDKGDAR